MCQIYVFTDVSAVNEATVKYSFLGEDYRNYEAQFSGIDDERKSALLVVETDALDAKFLEYATLYEGESVKIYYLSMGKDEKLIARRIISNAGRYKRMVFEEGRYFRVRVF